MRKEELRIEHLAADSYGDWTRLLADSPQGTIYSSPEYLAILCGATGGTFRLLGVRRGTELVGGVALYQEDTLLGTRIGGRRLLYYHSVLIRNYATRFPSQRTSRTLEILRAIEQAVSKIPHGRLRLENHWTLDDVRPFLDRGWQATPAYTYVADLTDIERLNQRVDRNFSRLIRRCRETDLVASEDDDFASLFRLHKATAERKNAPVYLPEAEFARFFQQLRGAGLCRLDHLRTPDGRSVASQLSLLGPYPTAHTVVAAADPEFMQLGTNPYLRWTVFEELARLGYVGNDLTDAALNSVTRFKSQLGADLTMWLSLSKKDRPAFAVASRLLSAARNRGLSYDANTIVGRTLKLPSTRQSHRQRRFRGSNDKS